MSPPRDKTACQTSPCKCKICISSIESDVYNKKKIKMFVVNMTFISSREVKKCILHSCRKMYISFVPSALMKYTFFHFNRFTPKIWISSIFVQMFLIWSRSAPFVYAILSETLVYNIFRHLRISVITSGLRSEVVVTRERFTLDTAHISLIIR